jgi:hypothetical protein
LHTAFTTSTTSASAAANFNDENMHRLNPALEICKKRKIYIFEFFDEKIVLLFFIFFVNDRYKSVEFSQFSSSSQ